MSGMITAAAVGAYAASRSAKMAKENARRALAQQQNQFYMSEEELRQAGVANEATLNPWISQGQEAQSQYLAQLGIGGTRAFDVTNLPGYQGALKQGIGAVNQGAAGAGTLMSGNRMRALQEAGQTVFGSYYSDYMNRLSQVAGRGQEAANTLASSRIGVAGGVANIGVGAGNAAYQGGIDQANIGLNKWSEIAGLIGKGAGAAYDRWGSSDSAPKSSVITISGGGSESVSSGGIPFETGY